MWGQSVAYFSFLFEVQSLALDMAQDNIATYT